MSLSHTTQKKGCLQFRYKPFFTLPSTLRHRKPTTTDTALVTILEWKRVFAACASSMCTWVCHCVLCLAVIIFHQTQIQLLLFPRQKMSHSVILDVFFCVCTKMCKYSSACISQETSAGPNCNSVLLAAVTIAYNLSEPSFALVYADIKPHTLYGKLKHTLSDSTAVHNDLDTR